MSKIFSSRSLVAVVLALAVTSASATLITIQGFYGGSPGNGTTVYINDQTLPGIFLLNGNPLTPTNFAINSATFKFSFRDDPYPPADPFTVVSSTMTTGPSDYHQVPGTNNFVRYAHTKETTLTTFEGESATLVFGATGVTVGIGSTQLFQISTSTPGPTTTVLDLFDDTNNFYTETSSDSTAALDDYSGTFDIAGSITDAGLLAELLANRSLTISLAVLGDLDLVGSRLELDVSEVTIGPNQIPEPGSISLAGIALAGAFLARRRACGVAKSGDGGLDGCGNVGDD